MRYGLPYKGSKNGIALWIVNNLPPAECFVDLFCGGGAVTHAAMLSGKWERFIMNDIDGRLPVLFRDCAYGKYTTKTHPEWIDRATFNVRKHDDAYIALVWSFGNNGKDYLYGADIEEFKHAYHILVFDGDAEPMRKLGFNLKLSSNPDAFKRYLQYSRQITKIFYDTSKHEHDLENYERLQTLERLESLYRLQSLQSLQSLQRLQSLQSLQSLQRLQSMQSLQSLQRDYRLVMIPQNALIYCDIPYADTNCGKYDGFDHDAFYAWAVEQDNIFISEYTMPEPFIEIASTQKSVLSTANGASGKVTEKLWTNPKTYARYGGICCDRQLTLF